MIRELLLCALVVSMTYYGREVRAETVPLQGVADSRVRTAVYDGNQVYRLQGYVGYQIDLQFERGEAFVGMGAGDIEGLAFVAQDNHLFIKPKATKVSTNLTVLTNRRAYEFDYAASSLRPTAGDPDVIFVVRFTYPGEHRDADRAELDKELEQSGGKRPINIDYWYCGSPAVKPIAASDDGVHTRLRFGARLEQPAIFSRNDDGSESLLNFSMSEGDVVIHRVVRELIVRRGRTIGRIVNKGFAGTGTRLESGTVSPDVLRAVEEIHP